MQASMPIVLHGIYSITYIYSTFSLCLLSKNHTCVTNDIILTPMFNGLSCFTNIPLSYLVLSCFASSPLMCIINVLPFWSHITHSLTCYVFHICYMLHSHVLLLVSQKRCMLLFHSLIHEFHLYFILPSILPHTCIGLHVSYLHFPMPRSLDTMTIYTYDSLVLKGPVPHQETPAWFF